MTDKITLNRAVVEQVLELLAKQRCDAKYEQDCRVCTAEEALRSAVSKATPLSSSELVLDEVQTEQGPGCPGTQQSEPATKPPALRLADELYAIVENGADTDVIYEAADELCRLYEAHAWQYTMAGERLRRIEKLEAENDRLRADAIRRAE